MTLTPSFSYPFRIILQAYLHYIKVHFLVTSSIRLFFFPWGLWYVISCWIYSPTQRLLPWSLKALSLKPLPTDKKPDLNSAMLNLIEEVKTTSSLWVGTILFVDRKGNCSEIALRNYWRWSTVNWCTEHSISIGQGPVSKNYAVW